LDLSQQILEIIDNAETFTTYSTIAKRLGKDVAHPQKIKRALDGLRKDGVVMKCLSWYKDVYKVSYERRNKPLENGFVVFAMFMLPTFVHIMRQKYPTLNEDDIKGIWVLAISCMLESFDHIPLVLPLEHHRPSGQRVRGYAAKG